MTEEGKVANSKTYGMTPAEYERWQDLYAEAEEVFMESSGFDHRDYLDEIDAMEFEYYEAKASGDEGWAARVKSAWDFVKAKQEKEAA